MFTGQFVLAGHVAHHSSGDAKSHSSGPLASRGPATGLRVHGPQQRLLRTACPLHQCSLCTVSDERCVVMLC